MEKFSLFPSFSPPSYADGLDFTHHSPAQSPDQAEHSPLDLASDSPPVGEAVSAQSPIEQPQTEQAKTEQPQIEQVPLYAKSPNAMLDLLSLHEKAPAKIRGKK